MKRNLCLIVMALFAGAMFFSSCQNEQYTITVNANDATMGTVTGGGKYNLNAEATLTATANDGYEFVQWNDGNKENPRTITVTGDATYTATFQRTVQAGVTISFNGNTWTAAQVDAYDYSADGYLTFVLFKTAGSQNDIYMQGWLESTVGSYTYNETQDYFKYYDASNTYTDETGELGGDPGDVYYNWTPERSSFVENITAIDLSNKTISATFSEDLYLLSDYVQQIEQYYPLNGTMNNATWTWQQDSKSAAKKSNSKAITRVR